MPRPLESRISVEPTYYEDTQLTDDEIVEREAVRLAWADYHARHERERRRRVTSFRWNGGMC